jgi:hypothetical protein
MLQQFYHHDARFSKHCRFSSKHRNQVASFGVKHISPIPRHFIPAIREMDLSMFVATLSSSHIFFGIS